MSHHREVHIEDEEAEGLLAETVQIAQTGVPPQTDQLIALREVVHPSLGLRQLLRCQLPRSSLLPHPLLLPVLQRQMLFLRAPEPARAQ